MMPCFEFDGFVGYSKLRIFFLPAYRNKRGGRMTEETAKLILKAEHALKVAQDLLEDGYPSDAASKIYYSMFYAAQALLKSKRIDVVKHSAVGSALGYHFAKTDRMGRFLTQ